MGLVLQDRPVAGLVLDHEPTDVAAWTLRRAGAVTTWQAPELAGSTRVAAWAALALAGCNYADLLYSELAALA